MSSRHVNQIQLVGNVSVQTRDRGGSNTQDNAGTRTIGRSRCPRLLKRRFNLQEWTDFTDKSSFLCNYMNHCFSYNYCDLSLYGNVLVMNASSS